MNYEVSRFGYYYVNFRKLRPGWQSRYIDAMSPEEAKEKALPLMDTSPSFRASEPAEVTVAKCRHHPRYQAANPPRTSCGACHAMYRAGQTWAKEGEQS